MKLFNSIKKFLFNRITLAILLLLIQIIILIFAFLYFNAHLAWIFGGFGVINTILVLYIINSHKNPSYKIAWIIPILVFPGLGALIYLFCQFQISIRYMRYKLDKEKIKSSKYIKQNESILSNLKKENKQIYNLANYTYSTCNYPVYNASDIKYFKVGEEFFKDLLEELNKAQEFIFLEYFIIDKGYMLNSILEILKKKASEGVEVRIMYDGFGSLVLLPYEFPSYLEQYGIKCKKFSPVNAIISTHQNYRDHRKICVIDSKVAYTGGANIADEYINMKKRFGHWKDTSIKVCGDVCDSFTVMFLELWNIDINHSENYAKYIKNYKEKKKDGYVIAYADSPLDDKETSKRIYMDMINNAKDYIHIITPYLIIDDEILSALTFASQKGVDVSIIIPGIPDKKLVYILTKSYYEELYEAGVKIYEYTNGFTHAKMFVVDDEIATVGTINLDYRSLYLHFECACLIYKNKVVKEIVKDFEDTIQKCHKITKNDIKNYSIIKKIVGRILRFLAPLM